MERRSLRVRQYIALVVSLYIATSALAAGPSFDCASASGQVEELICKDEKLAALDRQLADLYSAAEKRSSTADAASQQSKQRDWIKRRNACSRDTDVRACVDMAYRTRIIALQIMSGQIAATTSAAYTCEGHGSTPFLTAFYNDTDPPSALLTYGSDKVTAFIAPSGSGARYVADGVEFWDHHGEAMVTWFKTKLKCTVRK